MAGTITPLLTDISLCDADDWDGGVGALDIDSFIQGTGCLTITYTGAGLRAETTKTITAANFVTLGYPVIYGWLTFARLAMLETYANGGLRFIVKSSATAWSAWKVAGSDTAPTAGWNCYSVRTNQTPDYTGTTAADLTNITQVGWIVNLAIKGIVKWDAFRYGTGLTMTAGTEAAPATFDDIWAAEDTVANKYGIVTKYEGVYFVQGKLVFGSTTAGTATYFKDTSEAIVFKDVRVGSGFYEIKVQGNATATTQVYFGTKSGTAGISGCSFKAAGTPKYTLTATDTNITNLGLYGCAFLYADTISLPAYSTNKEVLNTSFEGCAEVLPNTCTVTNCNFISASARACRISSTAHNITASNFISCGQATHVPNIGTYTFNALKFSGNTYDIENSSSGLVTINATNGANPVTFTNTGGGSVTILNPKTLTVTVKDSSTNPIQGAQVWVQKDPADTDFGHEGNPFTSAAGNNQGDVDFVVTQAVPTDLPASGLITVNDVSEGEPQSYRYASKSGSTFTFPATVTGIDNGTGNATTINETGIGAKNIVEGDTIRNTTDTQFAIVSSVSANSVTTTTLSGGASWASDSYSVHTLAVTYVSGTDTATVPLMNEETNASGVATEEYNFGSSKASVIRIRRASSEPQYLPYSTTGTISGNFSLEATLTEDAVFV